MNTYKWHPITKNEQGDIIGLPTAEGEYLWTNDHGDVYIDTFIFVDIDENPQGCYMDSVDDITELLAWCELPKPYNPIKTDACLQYDCSDIICQQCKLLATNRRKNKFNCYIDC